MALKLRHEALRTLSPRPKRKVLTFSKTLSPEFIPEPQPFIKPQEHAWRSFNFGQQLIVPNAMS
jgi:hypothetical protein